MNFVYESEKLIALEDNIELGFIWYQFKNSELTIIQTIMIKIDFYYSYIFLLLMLSLSSMFQNG